MIVLLFSDSNDSGSSSSNNKSGNRSGNDISSGGGGGGNSCSGNISDHGSISSGEGSSIACGNDGNNDTSGNSSNSETSLWCMDRRVCVDNWEACRSDPGGYIFFSGSVRDRDGSWRACACVDERDEMACMRGRDRLVNMGA